MRNFKIVTAALIALVSVPALALEVNTKESSFQWKGTKKVGSFHTGKISLKSANVEMTKGKLSQAKFVMDMKSITSEDLKGK